MGSLALCLDSCKSTSCRRFLSRSQTPSAALKSRALTCTVTLTKHAVNTLKTTQTSRAKVRLLQPCELVVSGPRFASVWARPRGYRSDLVAHYVRDRSVYRCSPTVCVFTKQSEVKVHGVMNTHHSLNFN